MGDKSDGVKYFRDFLREKPKEKEKEKEHEDHPRGEKGKEKEEESEESEEDNEKECKEERSILREKRTVETEVNIVCEEEEEEETGEKVADEKVKKVKNWLEKSIEEGFAYCDFPFLLDATSKARILHIDAAMQMSWEVEVSRN